MKFASISLNGNTIYNLTNIKGNISPELKDIIESINATIDEKVIGKFIGMLNSNKYDIIAAQEVLNEDDFKRKILKKGYIIYHTETLRKSTRFFSAFLVKEGLVKETNYEIKNINLELSKYKNRFVEILIDKDKTTLKILNVHDPFDDQRATLKNLIKEWNPDKENIILLGDFNAASKNQRNEKSNKNTKEKTIEENTIFLDNIVKSGFVAMGKDDDFTYKTVEGLENKIDHIFFSNKLIETLELNVDNKKRIIEDKVKLVRKVNFMEVNKNEHENGFTDHSMLEFEIDF